MSHDPFIYFRASVLIASIGCGIADLELLSLFGSLKDGILAHERPHISEHPPLRHDSRAFWMYLGAYHYPLTLAAIAIRLAASLLIASSALRGSVSVMGLSIFVAASILLQLRGGLGNNGSDDMLLLIMFTSFLARLLNTSLCTSIALFFLSAQVSLAYLVSGLVKVSQTPWRNGISMIDLMSTETFGHRGLLVLLRSSPRGAALIATIFVFGELFGSFAPWLPLTYAVSLLCGALAFHLATALVMGLNTFVPAFVATYPAVIYTSLVLYRHPR
jgi:hypothetical protein